MQEATTINAVDLLMSQHAQLASQLDDLERGEPAEQAEQLRRLADVVAAHMTIEEELFYPQVIDESRRELLAELVEEHRSIKQALADLMELDPSDEEDFAGKLAVFKELFHQHAIEREDEGLFPQVRAQLDDDELAALGNELLAKYEELMAREPEEPEEPQESQEPLPENASGSAPQP